MSESGLSTALVRILTDPATPRRAVGAGVLVGERQVLTCAHVIEQALGLRSPCVTAPHEAVWLDLPLLAGRTALQARVLVWHPLRDSAGPGECEDIAVLELTAPPPRDAGPAPIVALHGDATFERAARLCEFPAGMDDGDWVAGRLQGPIANGWVQLDADLGRRGVVPGFSGTPVWDPTEQAVAGLIVSVQSRDGIASAYMIPVATLIAAWPELDARSRPPNPYRSLNAFREQDAPYFFGRDQAIDDLVDAVERQPLVALVGASGSGKSSLVMAGLVPRLRAWEHWLIARFRPRGDPFGELATALAPLLYRALDKQARREQRNAIRSKLVNGALTVADELAILAEDHPEHRVLLIADQFEELYTQNLPEPRQQRFIDALLDAIQTPEAPGTVLLVLRGDFMGRALDYGPLATALDTHATKFLSSMDTAALQAAIEQPAERLGVTLEPGLSERILTDLGREPGRLPLLEFALTQLWEHQTHRQLTHQAYDAIGGVNEALARHADRAYAELEADQERLQRIFVQLVRPGEGTEDTRQVATRDQVGAENWDLVTRLADQRLVVTSRDEDSGRETVEVVHEALIQHWQPLRDWMTRDRRFRLWQNRLRQALALWEEKDRDDGALLHGALLAEAEEWRNTHDSNLSPDEKTYIETSLARRDRDAAEREAQRRRELEAAEQLARTRYRAILGLSTGLVLVLVIALFAFWQSDQARKQTKVAEAAEVQAKENESRALAALSEVALNQHRYIDGVKLAVAAWPRTLGGDRLYLKATITALAKAQRAQRQILSPLRHEARVISATFDADETRILSWSTDRSVRLWDTASGEPLLEPLRHEGAVYGATFNADETRILSWSADRSVRLWDISRLPSGHLINVACARLPDHSTAELEDHYGIAIDEPICGPDVPAPVQARLVD